MSGLRGPERPVHESYDFAWERGHAGTMNFDVGLAIALLDEGRYPRLTECLRRDFVQHNAVGPTRVALFLTGGTEDDIKADVVGQITALLVACEK